MELNHWQPELGAGRRGYLQFGGGATALGPNGSPNQFNSYAQFLLGLSTNVQKAVQYEIMTGREWQYGAYLRDRWQVNKDLTVNLGLRWEKYPLMTRKNRGLEVYDQATNKVLLGGLGGNPEDLGIKVKHRHFLPRVGVAYRMGEDNVFRGGDALALGPPPLPPPLRALSPPTLHPSFLGANTLLPPRAPAR